MGNVVKKVGQVAGTALKGASSFMPPGLNGLAAGLGNTLQGHNLQSSIGAGLTGMIPGGGGIGAILGGLKATPGINGLGAGGGGGFDLNSILGQLPGVAGSM